VFLDGPLGLQVIAVTPPVFAPQTRNAAVLAELRQRIQFGILKPGDRILADVVAEEFGVSRIPVREALRVLEGERQVSYEPHHGYFVTELRYADLVELYLMRDLLESEALRRSVPKLDDADFASMDALLEELDVAHGAGDVQTHAMANRAFHFAFLEKLDMPRMLAEINTLYDQCDPYGTLYLNSAKNRKMSRRDHLALVRAAKKRDVEKVVELLLLHRDNVVDAMRGVFPDGQTFAPGDGRPAPTGARASAGSGGGAAAQAD
jgi:DNA-binding GntR family transcriptional regulator